MATGTVVHVGASAIVRAAIICVIEKLPHQTPRGCLMNSLGKELLEKGTVGDTVFDIFCH